MFPKVPRLGLLPQSGAHTDKTDVRTAGDTIRTRPGTPAESPSADLDASRNSTADTCGGEEALKALIAIRDQLEGIELDPQVEPESKRRVSMDGVRRAETLSRTLSRELTQLRADERAISHAPYLSPRMVGLSADAEGVCLPAYQVRRTSLDENALLRASALSQAEFRAMQARRVLDEICDLAGEPPNNLRDLLP